MGTDLCWEREGQDQVYPIKSVHIPLWIHHEWRPRSPLPSPKRPSVIYFTALSILILRNSAAMVDHGRAGAGGQRLPYVATARVGKLRSREEGGRSCKRWPDAIRPFPYPPPLQSFSPMARSLERKERDRGDCPPPVLFCMP